MPFSPMGSSLFQSPQLIFKALKHPYNGKSSSAHTFCFLLLSQRQLLFDSYWRKKVNWPLRLPQFFYIVCFNCFHFHNFGHYVLLILCFARLTFLNPWSLPCIWYDFTAWVRSRGNQIEVSSWVFSWWSHTRYAQFFSERIVTTYEKHIVNEESSSETQYARLLLGAGHVGTLCLVHPKIPDSQKESRCITNHMSVQKQFRSSRHLDHLGNVLYQCG